MTSRSARKGALPGGRIVAAAIFVAGALMAASAEARTVARVDGVEITDEDVRVATQDIGGEIPPQLEGAQRDAYVVDYLIDMHIVARKAEADKLAESVEFARRLAYLRDKALMEGLLTKVAKVEHGRRRARGLPRRPRKDRAASRKCAPCILVETEALARAALKRVRSGEDFAKVADQVSKDPGSRGGELGWFTKDRMVPEFADAAFKLQPNRFPSR